LTGIAELAGAQAGGSGSFQGKALRITDTSNGPGQDEPATVVDIGFPIPIDCVPTASAGTGSACGVNTTANALAPGAVQSGKLAIWQLGEIEVKDSGPDGTRGNGDDEVLEVQGAFLP
jgi:hypothetical protein